MKAYRKRLGVYIEEFGKECRYCGTTESLTIDHIVPKKLGGEDVRENFQVLCRHCNSLKHNMTEPELKEWLKKYVEKHTERIKAAKIILSRI